MSAFTLFPSELTAANRGAVDWGSEAQLLAYAAHAYVVLAQVDRGTLSRVQTLDAHAAPVTRVQWCAALDFAPSSAANVAVYLSLDLSISLCISGRS